MQDADHGAHLGSLAGPRERDRAHPDAPDQTVVVLPGANRLRCFVGDELIASAHFLCYDQRFPIVAVRPDGVQAVPGRGSDITANELSISFPASFVSDAAISRFLMLPRKSGHPTRSREAQEG